MTPARLLAASLAVLALAPLAARADDLCAQLNKAAGFAQGGFGSVEGQPRASNDNQYWDSTIQLSDGDNCSIEAHKMLTCSWEPSTGADLTKMVSSIAACFPSAQQTVVKGDDGEPPETDFKLDDATIEVGLTADVLSLNVGP